MATGTLLVVLSALGATDVELIQFSATWCGPCRAMQPVVDRLRAEGHQVRHIDIDQHPEMASQFRVRGVPCFVLMQGGRELNRVVGATSYEKLSGMLVRTRNSPPPPNAVIRGQSERAGSGKRFSLPGIARNKNRPPKTASISLPSRSVSASPNAIALAATVRLKVEDNAGSSYGTGTIIDVHENEALILTCGHVFRSSQGKGRIQVDLFHPGRRGQLEGTLVGFDLDRDVALVSFQPGVTVQPVRVASSEPVLHAGQKVLSIGCDRGGEPREQVSEITAVNRYLGPPNITVRGQPVDGRSGGGLFNSQGVLIGVCNAADPKDDEGLYAAVASVQAELDRAGLTHVYRHNDTLDQPQDQDIDSIELASQQEATGNGNVADGTQALNFEGDMEVVCIVRSKSDGNRPSKIIRFDRPPQDLLALLHRESNADLDSNPRTARAGDAPATGSTPPMVRGQNR